MNAKNEAIKSMVKEKEIAKDILLKALEHNSIVANDFPDAMTTIDVLCEAYKKILTAVQED